jgi:hypothetical protein
MADSKRERLYSLIAEDRARGLARAIADPGLAIPSLAPSEVQRLRGDIAGLAEETVDQLIDHYEGKQTGFVWLELQPPGIFCRPGG